MKLQENEERTKKWSKLKIKYIKIKSIKKVGGFNRLLNNERATYKNRGLKLTTKDTKKSQRLRLTQH